jgi:Allene oxide cyclase barrel like domain
MSDKKVIKLVARPIAREVIKNGPAEVNLGDRSVFTNELYIDDEKVGFDGGVTTVVRIDEDGAYYILCNISMNLPDGMLTFQTFIQEIFPNTPPFYTAITGGTGAYRNARGEVHVDPASPEIHFFTVYLEGSDTDR